LFLQLALLLTTQLVPLLLTTQLVHVDQAQRQRRRRRRQPLVEQPIDPAIAAPGRLDSHIFQLDQTRQVAAQRAVAQVQCLAQLALREAERRRPTGLADAPLPDVPGNVAQPAYGGPSARGA